ncbi:MAG TPA: hypothetical protein VF666_10090 [Pyrinomonadaceae bacterium]|jgi:quercetin dioxygenase-like cupin family protein
MGNIERITWKDKMLACIIKAETDVEKTTFLTPSEYNFQVGFVAYPKDGEIPAHVHRPVERRIFETFEVLLVRKGRCEVDIFNDERERIATRELREGDLLLVVEGGHGFRMLEDAVLLEVKQGPYLGDDSKETF